MDTKLRSNDPLEKEEPTLEILEKTVKKGNIAVGIILIALLCFLTTSIIGLAFATLAYQGRFSATDSLRNSYRVRDAVGDVGYTLFRYYAYYGGPSFETLLDEQKVNAADIDARMQEMYWQNTLNIDWHLIQEGDQEERKSWEERIQYELENSGDLFQSILREKNEDYTALKLALEREELIYDIENIITGEHYSNAHIAEPMQLTFYLHDQNVFRDWVESEGTNVFDAFSKKGWRGSVSIPYLSEENDNQNPLFSFIDEFYRMYSTRMDYPAFLVTCLLVLIPLLWISLKVAKQSVRLGFAGLLKCYNIQPLFMKILLAFFALIGFVAPLDSFSGMYFDHWYYSVAEYNRGQIGYLIMASIALLYMSLSAGYVGYLSKDIKRIKKNPDLRLLLYAMSKWPSSFKAVKKILFSKNLPLKLIFLLTTGLLIVGFLFAMLLLFGGYYFGEVLIACIFYLFALLIGLTLTNLIIAYIKIESYIQKLSSGELEVVPEEKGFFCEPINNLNNISLGLQKNLAKTLQNERMKTELITNVSHDLKTPLTSIITYVALLKKLSPQEHEKSVEYLSILEMKSERLKILIEDLFEAAKLTSGAIDLNVKQVDIVALLNQTLGELEEKIQASNLDFRVTMNAHKLYVMLDGRKVWRAFENLINNILKYSQENTRVYIQMEETDSLAIVTMKNVSAYELNFDGQEVMERFVRGDAARSTEGSGLGLSIAKNIVELHGGEFQILIDGDLFKVSMYFKK